MTVHAAGIGILAKGGLKDGRTRAPKGLRRQIDGFGGAVGDTHFVGLQLQPAGQPGF